MDLRGVQKFGLIAAIGSIVTSCSTGPAPPQVGTPAFYWSAAKETYSAGDYLKTIEHLENVARTQNQYTARALSWNLLLTAGMAKGYTDLADNFEEGSRANRSNPTPFRRQASDYRTYASRLALEFAQTLENFEKTSKDPTVLLDFVYPGGTAIPSPQLSKIANGQLFPPDILDDIRKQQLKTALLLETCRIAGAADDVAKTEEIFKPGKAQVQREVFMLEMASAMYELGQLFGHAKLDQPQRLEFFDTHALDIVKTLPESKGTKALTDKIAKSLKQVKAT